MTEPLPASQLYTDQFAADPYPALARLRANAPVCPVSSPRFDSYLLTRFDDARAALADPRLSKDLYGPGQHYLQIFGPNSEALNRNMLNADPPEHTRLRRLVSQAFAPRRIEALRPRVRQIVDDLIDGFVGRGRAELMHDFAIPLPMVVICELLGVPRADQGQVLDWTQVIRTSGSSRRPPAQERAAVGEAQVRLHHYLAGLVAAKRAEPADDLVSALIDACDQDGRLSEAELVTTTFLLLFAGHQTTADFLGNATVALLTHPDQLDLLRDTPELLPSAIEELLRFDGPLPVASPRVATEDVEYRGCTSRPGRSSGWRSTRPTTIRRTSSTRTGWTCGGSGGRTWASATACTTASGSRWPGWRPRSGWRCCCAGSPGCASRCRSTSCAGCRRRHRSGACWSCRSGSSPRPRRCRPRRPVAPAPPSRPLPPDLRGASMTFRNVIVCRMVPGSEQTVADVFGYYDRTTRPQDLGVVGRTLLSFHGLYIHLIERNADPKVTGQTRGLPAFQQIAEKIGPYVTPYPRDWQNPSDSVAKEFYSWTPAEPPAGAGDLPAEPPAGAGEPSRTVIVARIKPGAEPTVAQIFAESDAGPLPTLMGVTGRWLYSIDDVYLHVLERVGEEFDGVVEEQHDQPAFSKIMDDLSPYISPFDPDTWGSPVDAVATEFYRWRAED